MTRVFPNRKASSNSVALFEDVAAQNQAVALVLEVSGVAPNENVLVLTEAAAVFTDTFRV